MNSATEETILWHRTQCGAESLNS